MNIRFVGQEMLVRLADRRVLALQTGQEIAVSPADGAALIGSGLFEEVPVAADPLQDETIGGGSNE